MSIQIDEATIAKAEAVLADWSLELDESLIPDLLQSIELSLPAYWSLYLDNVDSIESASYEEKAEIYRGLASNAMQNAMADKFGFRLSLFGDKLFSDDIPKPLNSVAELFQRYPKGYTLASQIVHDAQEGKYVFDPAPGSPEEPDEETHFQLMAIVADQRFHKYLESMGMSFIFRNCCSGFTAALELNPELEAKRTLFGSIATQIVAQLPERQALCC